MLGPTLASNYLVFDFLVPSMVQETSTLDTIRWSSSRDEGDSAEELLLDLRLSP